ncbi:MAG: aminotransferase class V-fold PLP-dependent enzyme [candidate division Zixibacteria bacterium]|nr:aminotransferase class V-fold PLP-dependent enzyme [candidate division Zixibacteria bacterium]
MLSTTSIRRLFPHTSKFTYFNSASNGPLPSPAYKIQEKQYQIARDAVIGSQDEQFEALKSISSNGAKILGCKTSEVGFGFNTTFGLNLAAFGLPLKSGDEILLSDIEFPANVYPWLELKRRGVKVKFIKSVDGFFNLGRFTKAITQRTRILAISFVQFFNGYKNDLSTLGEICKRHNIFFVVDAIQGAGIEPLHLKKWGVDIASSGAHKWLLSSQGTGIFYVSEEIQERIKPPWRSWMSIDWNCDWSNLRDFTRDYPKSARQYELGTYPVPLLLSLDWSLQFINQLGVKNIQSHTHELIDLLIDYINCSDDFRVTSSIEKKFRSGIISFTSDKLNIDSVFGSLKRKNIITSVREGAIRVAVHAFNNKNDINKLITALDQASS